MTVTDAMRRPFSSTDWMEYTHEYFKGTVFSTKCRSWYKRGLEGLSASVSCCLLLFVPGD